jgi:hypothetical protein
MLQDANRRRCVYRKPHLAMILVYCLPRAVDVRSYPESRHCLAAVACPLSARSERPASQNLVSLVALGVARTQLGLFLVFPGQPATSARTLIQEPQRPISVGNIRGPKGRKNLEEATCRRKPQNIIRRQQNIIRTPLGTTLKQQSITMPDITRRRRITLILPGHTQFIADITRKKLQRPIVKSTARNSRGVFRANNNLIFVLIK